MPLEEEQGYRFADDVGTADDNSVLAGEFTAKMLEKLDDSVWSGWEENRVADGQMTNVDRMEAVYVLVR